jgi:hypothetical protein
MCLFFNDFDTMGINVRQTWQKFMFELIAAGGTGESLFQPITACRRADRGTRRSVHEDLHLYRTVGLIEVGRPSDNDVRGNLINVSDNIHLTRTNLVFCGDQLNKSSGHRSRDLWLTDAYHQVFLIETTLRNIRS